MLNILLVKIYCNIFICIDKCNTLNIQHLDTYLYVILKYFILIYLKVMSSIYMIYYRTLLQLTKELAVFSHRICLYIHFSVICHPIVWSEIVAYEKDLVGYFLCRVCSFFFLLNHNI